MDNLGFVSIESLCVHRLLDAEIVKLGCLVGDDLWSMLMKIIACEELIELMERKNGMVKKRALKRTYNNYAEKVVQILPKKIELKKNIQTQLTLQNHFFGLLEIIQNRQNVILTHQVQFLDDTIDPLNTQLKEAYFVQHKKEREFAATCQKRENIRNLRFSSEKVHNNIDEAISEISFFSPPSFCFEDFLDIFQDLNNTKVSDISENNLELAGWKILLKESENEEDLMLLNNTIEVGKEVNNILNEYKNEIEKDISLLEERMESLNSEVFLNDMKEHFQNEKKILTLNSEDDIIRLRAKIADALVRINEAAFVVQISPQLKSDLITVEDLVYCDEDLKEFYLGPLFKFLEPSTLSCKFWPQLINAANLILFKTAEAALRTTFIFYELKSNSSCTLIGIDKFLENIPKNAEQENDYVTAKSLIKSDVEEPLKLVLAFILGKFVIADKEISNLTVTCYDETFSTIYHEGSSSVIGQLPNSIWSKYGSNPIKALQEFYSYLEKRNNYSEQIKNYESVRIEARNELKRQKLSILNKSIRQKAKKIFDTILHYMLLSRKHQFNNSNIQSFQELIGCVATDMEGWDVEVLKNEMNQLNKNLKYDKEDINPLKILQTFISNQTLQLFEDINEDSYNAKNKAAKEKLRTLQKFHKNMGDNISQMYKTSIELINKIYLEDSNDQEMNAKFGYAYAQKCLINMLADYMKSCAKSSIVTKSKHEIFEKYQNKDDNVVLEKLAEVHGNLFKEKNEKNLRLTNLTADSYTKLKESIEKVPKYAGEEVFTPLEVKKRAYPMMNFLVVKMLRDTVHHFKVSYNVIFSEYLSQSSLFFYTHGEINEELEEDKFSWNCFDMTRLKSLDFVDKWENHKSKINNEKIKQIKGFLLILHMINYISIFKFIIVSSKIFEELNESLEMKIRAFLKTISTYVQVIIIEENREINEPMDTSE
jgi:hypothetical protein